MTYEERQARLRGLLITARCPTPSCRDGVIPHQTSDGWEPEQCEWCWTRAQLLGLPDPTTGEPAGPDGECFRGGEAAAYEAEQMARIQREFK